MLYEVITHERVQAVGQLCLGKVHDGPGIVLQTVGAHTVDDTDDLAHGLFGELPHVRRTTADQLV